MADDDDTRRVAVEAHGLARTLLAKPERSEEETARMIGAARASLAAWEAIGGPVEAQRGNWLLARVYVDAGLNEPALEFARRTMELTGAHQAELADFDLAFAEEIAARAWASTGNVGRAEAHYHDAKRLGLAIKDADDRAEFFRQFGIGPWFGLDRL